jgi:Cof subfamily protein (haloacid dehalogenase superfamily)
MKMRVMTKKYEKGIPVARPRLAVAPPKTAEEPGLLACDLDGTLLDPRGTIRPPVLAAVRAVKAAGVEVAVATGRSPWDAAPAARALGLTGPQIVMNGGALMWPDGRRFPWASRLDFELVVDAIAFARGAGLHPLLSFTDGHVCESRRGSAPAIPDFAYGPRLRVVDRLEDMAGRRPVRVYMPTRPDEHAQILSEIREWFGGRASIVYGDRYGVEVMGPGVDKGSALRRLAESLRLGPERVAAIGDGPNDREMLEYAGRRAVLLPNDPESVGVLGLVVRHLVVPPSDEDGAVEALARFFPSLPVRAAARAAAERDQHPDDLEDGTAA